MAQQPNDHQEPIDGLINYNDIHDYKGFQETFGMSLTQIRHIWGVHWEIDPESANSLLDVVADMMKAFASTYHRGIQEGWIPPNMQYIPMDGEVKDIHENQ